MINKRDIVEFKKLYKARYGVVLDNLTARQRLSKLLKQVELVYKPITQQQLDDYNEEKEK